MLEIGRTIEKPSFFKLAFEGQKTIKVVHNASKRKKTCNPKSMSNGRGPAAAGVAQKTHAKNNFRQLIDKFVTEDWKGIVTRIQEIT